MKRLSVVLALGLALGACEKKSEPGSNKKQADVTAGTRTESGARRIEVEAGKGGYTPEKIMAKPNEDLVLVFKRTVEGECLRQVKVADGAVIDLPMNQPVEIPVKAPASGELAFVCGMDMISGVIAVN